MRFGVGVAKKKKKNPPARDDISLAACLDYLSEWRTHREMADHFNASRVLVHKRTGRLLEAGLVDFDIRHSGKVGKPAGIYRRKRGAVIAPS